MPEDDETFATHPGGRLAATAAAEEGAGDVDTAVTAPPLSPASRRRRLLCSSTASPGGGGCHRASPVTACRQYGRPVLEETCCSHTGAACGGDRGAPSWVLPLPCNVDSFSMRTALCGDGMATPARASSERPRRALGSRGSRLLLTLRRSMEDVEHPFTSNEGVMSGGASAMASAPSTLRTPLP